MQRFCSSRSLLVLGWMLAAAEAPAAGVVGNGSPASCTEAALDAALAGGGSVTFDCGSGPVTIPITQQKLITAATTIDGGSAERIVLDAGNTTRHFLSDTSVPLTIRNLTLRRGRCPYPTDGNLVAGYGGSIRAGLYSALTVQDSRILDNSCLAIGNDVGAGAFFAQRGTILVERSYFSGNVASNGGAIGVNHAVVTIHDSVFENNTTLAHTSSFDGVGGAFYVDEANGGLIVIRRSTFTDNSAAFAAGAVHVYLANADQGVLIEDSTFQGNSTTFNGGAVFHQNKPLTIRGCTFVGNTTVRNGGGLYVVDSPALSISNSTFSGNSATGASGVPASGTGGAMLLYERNTTLAGSLSHLTIADNHAGHVGGGIATSGAVSLSLRGSIVADNTATIGAGCNTQLQDGGSNLQFPSGSPKCTAGAVIADPQLAPLADNGGPTRTRALPAASPARNAVTSGCPPPAADQRGVARPQLGACDIGAFEAAPMLSIDDVSAGEGTGGASAAVFTVTLSPASSEPVSVGYATANGTALAGSDYTATAGTLSFPAGATTRTISVPLATDASDENDETFLVTLSGPVNAAIADGQGVGTISDDDPPPSASISDCTVPEGDAGAVPCVFSVSVSPPSGKTVAVGYATADGTALAGSDYTAASGTLTFPPGLAVATASVLANGDTADEADETFAVNLAGPVNATLGDAQGIGTIDDDDGPGVVISDPSASEGDAGTQAMGFTVGLTATSPQDVTVQYATSDGTARAGVDYVAAASEVTVAAGTTSQPLVVMISGDFVDEPDEGFYVNLLGATNGTVLDASGRGTILDDDGGVFWVGELSHGFVSRGDLEGGEDLFILSQPPRSSGEIVVDEASGDVMADAPGGGPGLELLHNDMSPAQDSVAVGVGAVRSLRWQNAGSIWSESYVRARSLGCTSDCGADDTYRLKALDTTGSIPRFNNAGSQVTVLILQNPTEQSVSGTVLFWDAQGALRASHAFTLASRATLVLNTRTLPDLVGLSGALTVVHDGRYGELTGKAVALEPATGYSFDSPMGFRPR